MNRKFISKSNFVLRKVLNSKENIDILKDIIESILEIKIKKIELNPYLYKRAKYLPSEENFGTGSGRDHVRLEFHGNLFQSIVVDGFGFLGNTVVDDIVKLAGEVGLVTVGQVAAMGEIHRQDGIARFENGKVDGHVGLGTRVRLDIGVVSAEDLQDPVDGELFDHVDKFTSSVPAAARIAFSIFVGQEGSLGFADGP